jgi:hypothetical protein
MSREGPRDRPGRPPHRCPGTSVLQLVARARRLSREIFLSGNVTLDGEEHHNGRGASPPARRQA